MRIVAAVFADFAETFLGAASRLLDPLGGLPVIARSLSRLAQVEGAAARCLFVRARDESVGRIVVSDAGLTARVDLLAQDDIVRRRRQLFRSARKWNLTS